MSITNKKITSQSVFQSKAENLLNTLHQNQRVLHTTMQHDMEYPVAKFILSKATLTHEAAKQKVAAFASRHKIEINYVDDYIKGSKIKQLEEMPRNSALVVGSGRVDFMRQDQVIDDIVGKVTLSPHRDTFIKDENGDIINVFMYAELCIDTVNYNPTQYYNNDIMIYFLPLLDKKVLHPQADKMCCFAFSLEYAKVLLAHDQYNLKERSFKFELVDNEAKILTRHFIPCAKVLKYSQSDAYNQAIFDFVGCEQAIFTLPGNIEALSLYGLLSETKRIAQESDDQILLLSTEEALQRLVKFRENFIADYKQFVEPYRGVHGKVAAEEELGRCMFALKGDESSVE